MLDSLRNYVWAYSTQGVIIDVQENDELVDIIWNIDNSIIIRFRLSQKLLKTVDLQHVAGILGAGALIIEQMMGYVVNNDEIGSVLGNLYSEVECSICDEEWQSFGPSKSHLKVMWNSSRHGDFSYQMPIVVLENIATLDKNHKTRAICDSSWLFMKEMFHGFTGSFPEDMPPGIW